MGKMTACEGCTTAGSVEFAVDITMAFQPIVDIPNQCVWGYEALVRGRNGESAFEVLSHVTPDNKYLFDQRCRVLAVELAAEHMPERSDAMLSINFMPNAVYEPKACIRATLAATARTGFSPSRLMFEFTESEQITDTAHIRHIVTEYGRMGFTTAIDDFGAGFAGLGLLAEFQTDIVKIDMALVRDLDLSASRRAILAGIIEMSRQMGFKILAEGVETEAEATVLRDAGVTLMQGYFFAKPQVEHFCPAVKINWV